jgi:uncharacterized ferredoxin-like protein
MVGRIHTLGDLVFSDSFCVDHAIMYSTGACSGQFSYICAFVSQIP